MTEKRDAVIQKYENEALSSDEPKVSLDAITYPTGDIQSRGGSSPPGAANGIREFLQKTDNRSQTTGRTHRSPGFFCSGADLLHFVNFPHHGFAVDLHAPVGRLNGHRIA